ncbi:NB-ARC domain-containing protein [Dactylosporangium sp. NBC_01737]|uniref:NB-ARC domain-containing protein n=1 Tax=Dactylosporangium sp. NBC_01737 TaxID=2975959 RepID=UPI002E14221A|nr:NB-ARC domain-containing protein [Dactylosporangium sp. NBC_01737]
MDGVSVPMSFSNAQGIQVNLAPGNTQINVFELPPASVTWPMRIGRIPLQASAFQPRAEAPAIMDIDGGRGTPTLVLSGGGGVGKSQLAAWCCAEAAASGLDLVLWIDGRRVDTVVDGYAEAAGRIRVPGVSADGDQERDAAAFLDWLATTDRRWLVVLDDVTDVAQLAGWWPAGSNGSGRVLATTRRQDDAALSGSGRTVVTMDVFRPGESRDYLRSRLREAGRADLIDDALDGVAEDLGHLPLALSHAAGYLINEAVTGARYRRLLSDTTVRLDALLPPNADADGYGRHVPHTLLLTIDAAVDADPNGFVAAALRLVSVLDPAGHPVELWAHPAIAAHLTRHRTWPMRRRLLSRKADGDQVRATLAVLHRYGLLTNDGATVRTHALTARAVREAAPAAVPGAVGAATRALLELWPETDHVDGNGPPR